MAGAWANIPGWQQTELQKLSSQGRLSGIDPRILSVMELAEMNPSLPPAVNSSGFGGYFGLAPNTPYPGGNTVSPTTLVGTDPASYDAQAVTAAAELSSLLGSHGGNLGAAESAYQGGSTEGASLLASYGFGSGPTAYTAPSTSPGAAAIAQVQASSGSSDLGQFTVIPGFSGLGTSWGGIHIAKSSLVRVGLGLVGIVLLFIAVNALLHSNAGDGPITVVTTGGRQTLRKANQRTGTPHTPMHVKAEHAAEGAGEAAA